MKEIKPHIPTHCCQTAHASAPGFTAIAAARREKALRRSLSESRWPGVGDRADSHEVVAQFADDGHDARAVAWIEEARVVADASPGVDERLRVVGHAFGRQLRAQEEARVVVELELND